MIKSARQMIKEVLLGANKSVDDLTSMGSDYSNAVMGLIDDKQDSVCDEMMTANPYMLATYYDLTLTGAQSYYLPSYIPFNYETILMVEDITGGVTEGESTITTIWGDRMKYIDSSGYATGSVIWSIRDQYLELPQLNTGTLRIWYSKKPTGLFYGSATAGTTTTATFTAATVGQLVMENDYYIGMFLMHDSQARRVTDFTISGLNAAFTVDAWTTAPSVADVLDLVSPLPRNYHQRIVREATIALRATGDDPVRDLVVLSDREAIIMTRRLRRPQIQGPEFIRRVDR